MGYTSLKAALFAAAQQNAGLVYYLGGSSPTVLRWYDEQLPQAAGTGFPSVVVKQISNPQTYATAGRLPTSWARMEFTIFGTGADSVNADAIAQALYAFLDTFNGDGITGRPASPNYIVSDRDEGIAITQPLTYQRIVEARIFWNPEGNDMTPGLIPFEAQISSDQLYGLYSGGPTDAAVTALHAGTGYAIGDTFYIGSRAGGNGNGKAIGTVLTIGAGGAVVGFNIAGGAGYALASGVPTVTITGAGSGLEINITAVAAGTRVIVIPAAAGKLWRPVGTPIAQYNPVTTPYTAASPEDDYLGLTYANDTSYWGANLGILYVTYEGFMSVEAVSQYLMVPYYGGNSNGRGEAAVLEGTTGLSGPLTLGDGTLTIWGFGTYV